jgi:hypothetical protein
MKLEVKNENFFEVVVVVVLLFLCSCQEVFTDDEINNDQKILVVQGEITDNLGPYKILLRYASDFGSEKIFYATGAAVYLMDSDGYNGEYWSDVNGIKGTIGRYYSLYIKLNNQVYESEKQLLSEPVYSDSIYAEPGTYDYSASSSDGKIIRKTLEGIYVYADINVRKEESSYFLFNKKVIWQNTRICSPPMSDPFTLYFRLRLFVDNLPDVKVTQWYKGENIIKRHLLYFLPYTLDMTTGIEDKDFGPYVNEGWVSYVYISEITKEAYSFYSDAATQMSAKMQLFDPIPSQVKSNIVCKTNSKVPVMGLFKVYTQKNRYNGFYWSPGKDKVIQKEIINPGPIVTDTNRRKPDYWVDFF